MRVVEYEQLNILDLEGSRDQVCFHGAVISHVDNDDLEGTEICRTCETLWMSGRRMEMPDAAR